MSRQEEQGRQLRDSRGQVTVTKASGGFEGALLVTLSVFGMTE